MAPPTPQFRHALGPGHPVAPLPGLSGTDHDFSASADRNSNPPRLVADKSDTEFSVVGTWTAKILSGKWGGDYLEATLYGQNPNRTIVDNTDPGFSVTGSWLTWSK